MLASDLIKSYEAFCPPELSMEGDVVGLQIGSLDKEIQKVMVTLDVRENTVAEAIEKANAKGCDLWTAVQAYNFGLDYIDYVAENGKKHSLRLAEQYSKDRLSPQMGNTAQTRYRYLSLRSVFYNGGYLYHNGGNFFYSELVKVNEKKIKQTDFLF